MFRGARKHLPRSVLGEGARGRCAPLLHLRQRCLQARERVFVRARQGWVARVEFGHVRQLVDVQLRENRRVMSVEALRVALLVAHSIVAIF